jgi:DNA polymerase IV (DinB-like DNA polymerase)
MTGETRRIILHIDMDAFYASVEIHRRPELTGKAVIIGADPKGGRGRGVVATASYEARKYGIFSAMPVSKAYALCPEGIYLPPDFTAYAEVSSGIMSVLRTTGFPFEQVSIDEAFLDVTTADEIGGAEALARDLKEKIRARSGLTCSIGIGPSRVVAKIASGYKKPDGLTVVPEEKTAAFLAPLPARKIPGIGPKTERELAAAGIRTIGDIQSAGVEVLLARFGRGGTALQRLAFGYDGRAVAGRKGPRSVSRETTFEQDTDDPGVLDATLEELVQDVHRSITGEMYRFRTVTVKVRYTGFITKTRAHSLSHNTDDIRTIRSVARALFRDLPAGRTIRLVGLRLSDLEAPDRGQTTLGV